MNIPRIRALLMLFTAVAALSISGRAALAKDRTELDGDARAALALLYSDSPTAKALGERAKGILVFPNIVKAGFLVGAQGGDGILIKKDATVGYYNTAAVSYGLQAGVQTYGYVLFFVSDAVMTQFEDSSGWEIGVGPSIVVVDAGAARDLTTITGKADIYSFIFDQKGLMAGMGLKGSKITKLSP
jgi:lipid-binding SYLF domain-containing protein